VSGALILTGGPGAGKSSVLDALSTLLEIEEVPFGAVESEQLARGHPWLAAAEWIPQLAAVVAMQRRAGRDTFLVVATTEDEDQLRAVIEAVDTRPVLVVCLSAPPELAAERVAAREPDVWLGKGPLVDHARILASEIPTIRGIDVVISTVDRAEADVAAEIRQALQDRGILPQQLQLDASG
jgi:thymidylate kinase